MPVAAAARVRRLRHPPVLRLRRPSVVVAAAFAGRRRPKSRGSSSASTPPWAPSTPPLETDSQRPKTRTCQRARRPLPSLRLAPTSARMTPRRTRSAYRRRTTPSSSPRSPPTARSSTCSVTTSATFGLSSSCSAMACGAPMRCVVRAAPPQAPRPVRHNHAHRFCGRVDRPVSALFGVSSRACGGAGCFGASAPVSCIDSSCDVMRTADRAGPRRLLRAPFRASVRVHTGLGGHGGRASASTRGHPRRAHADTRHARQRGANRHEPRRR